MSLPENVREILMDVGQVAVEVPCPIEGCREFVSVSATAREKVMNVEGRFPYLDEAPMIYRCIRFRVKSLMIEQDADVGPHDLIGLQELNLPSEEGVEFVLRIWKVPPESLRPPKDVDIPV